MKSPNIFRTLRQRSLVQQLSNQALETDASLYAKKLLLNPQSNQFASSVYIGFDPTAESIHLGNYLGFLALKHFQLQGFRPIILFGGATGLIGDPSGRSSERNLLTLDQVQANVDKFQEQFNTLDLNFTKALERQLPEGGEAIMETHGIEFVNNYDFYKGMSAISFLRDVGKNFRVSTMLSRDSVKSRMPSNLTGEGQSDEGLSFTEFSYQIL